MIQTQAILVHLDSGLNASSAYQYTAFEDAFTSSAITVTTVDETLSLGDVVTPRTIELKLISGDPVRVGLDGSTYPFRLREAGESALIPLDVDGLREISSITAGADTSYSLSGDYFDLTDRTGTVRVWFNMTGKPEISEVQIVTVAAISDKYFDLTDSSGTVRVWCDVDAAGTPPATPGGGRLLEVDILSTDTVAQALDKFQAAIDADAQFICTDDGVDTLTITDAANGTRADVAEPDTATYFSVSVTQQGVANSSAPATPGGGRLLPVVIDENATAPTVATALQTALDADDEFTATVATATVTVTDQHTGTRTNIADGTTGWTMSATQQGAASPVIHLKSTGTSQALVAIAPN